MMKGWNTWAAVIGTAILGIVDIANDEMESGIMKLSGAFALLGIGHKIEKSGK
jgi:hypothetical protein